MGAAIGACCASDMATLHADDPVLYVTTDGAWASQSSMPLRVPLSARVDENRVLWRARITTLKHVLLAALRVGREDQLVDQASNIVVAIVACGRCGRPSGCRCGWRRVHAIPTTLESRSLAQLILRLLPLRAYAAENDRAAPQSLQVRLFQSVRPPDLWLEAAVTSVKIVDPMIERPRAVYRVIVRFGEQEWVVSRRFQEFATLHATLMTSFGETLLPPLPTTTWFRHLDDAFLHARRKALDAYLCCLVLIDCVRDSVTFLSFLGAISTAQETLLTATPHTLCSSEVLHLRVLPYYVRAGDLVLFQSRGIVSALQRSATGSEWDHVAVVVPRARDDENKGFLLLEATGDGVTALSLTSRLYAYSAYHTNHIALRQLQTPLLTDPVRSELLDRYTVKVKGRPYGLSVSKVLRTNEPHDHNYKTDAGTDFFCSELVADAYKAMGLIDSRIPSSNFWPSSFAPGAFVDAELGRHGATLGTPVAIDCLMLEVALARRCIT